MEVEVEAGRPPGVARARVMYAASRRRPLAVPGHRVPAEGARYTCVAALRGGCTDAMPALAAPPTVPLAPATAALAALSRDDAQMALVHHVGALLADAAPPQRPPHYVHLMLCRVVRGTPALEVWMRDAEARAAAAEPDHGLAHLTMVSGALAHALPLAAAAATEDDFETFLVTVRTQLLTALNAGLD